MRPAPDFACQSSALPYLLPLFFSRVALEAVSLFLPAGAGEVSVVCGFPCSVGLGQVAAGISRRWQALMPRPYKPFALADPNK